MSAATSPPSSSSALAPPRRRMFEGVGAPVDLADVDRCDDPTLDSCCQREVESNRKRDALETALRANDRVARAEADRREQRAQFSLDSSPNPNNLVELMGFAGKGCRCCYDPNEDGGEYELLVEARRERDAAKGSASAFDDGVGDARWRRETAPDEKKEVDGDDDNVDSDDDDDDSDDEFDYLLDEPLPGDPDALRRAELEGEARRIEVARGHGYGVHRQVHPRRAFAAAGYGAKRVRDALCPRGAALHLYDASSPRSASLDLCLEDAAGRHPGTKFVRSVGATARLFAEGDEGGARWKDADLPALLALRDGEVVACSPGLRDFCGGDGRVEPDAVERWLEGAGVLIREAPPAEDLCRIRPEEEALLDNLRRLNRMGIREGGKDEDFDGEREGKRYDCGVAGCHKAFYHEHVGVKTEVQDGLLVREEEVATSPAG
ncbi:hypothetical protein ACHAWF_013437 [Thalassiosira exigua]